MQITHCATYPIRIRVALLVAKAAADVLARVASFDVARCPKTRPLLSVIALVVGPLLTQQSFKRETVKDKAATHNMKDVTKYLSRPHVQQHA